MNILILDDDPYKRESLRETLDSFGENEYHEFESMQSGVYYLAKNAENIDLLLLDWVFPVYDGYPPRANMGLEVLAKLSRFPIQVPIIVCSSDEVVIPEKYQKSVLGQVVFDPMRDQTTEYQQLLSKISKGGPQR